MGVQHMRSMHNCHQVILFDGQELLDTDNTEAKESVEPAYNPSESFQVYRTEARGFEMEKELGKDMLGPDLVDKHS